MPAVKSVPCRAAQRAEGSAQARPATCFGPARTQLGSGRAVLGPGQMTVLWAVPLARGLHAHLYAHPRVEAIEPQGLSRCLTFTAACLAGSEQFAKLEHDTVLD